MTKKQYYAVRKGRQPGVFSRWTGAGGAEEQIKGFPGAVFRGFATREEAEHFLRTGEVPLAQPALTAVEPEKVARSERAAQQPDHLPDLQAGKVVIFTDGASTGNPGPGGYGVLLLHGDARREMSGGFRCTTNNRMELMGVIVALQSLKRPAPVVLYSDSRYVVDAVEKGWARRWRMRGWMRSDNNPAENPDLWAQLLNLLDQHQVEFRWVRGHASNAENERCDRLAVDAAHQKGLPEDEGFKGRC